jgi:hypothetical protein
MPVRQALHTSHVKGCTISSYSRLTNKPFQRPQGLNPKRFDVPQINQGPLGGLVPPIQHIEKGRTLFMKSQLLAHCGTEKITREQLGMIPVPEGTDTYQPLAHHLIVEALIEALTFRHISVVRDEYAVSDDGMKMFGVIDLETTFEGCRFSIGVRNANDKSMRLAMTVGYRVFVCDNMAFHGDFTPVLAKHTKNFSLVDSVSVGVDRMQRSFEPMQRQIGMWKRSRIADEGAKLAIYRAFVEGELEAPKYLARRVHNLYFNPTIEEFAPRTLWSLENAFTSAFKELDPMPQFRATAKLAPFLAGMQQFAEL